MGNTTPHSIVVTAGAATPLRPLLSRDDDDRQRAGVFRLLFWVGLLLAPLWIGTGYWIAGGIDHNWAPDRQSIYHRSFPEENRQFLLGTFTAVAGVALVVAAIAGLAGLSAARGILVTTVLGIASLQLIAFVLYTLPTLYPPAVLRIATLIPMLMIWARAMAALLVSGSYPLITCIAFWRTGKSAASGIPMQSVPGVGRMVAAESSTTPPSLSYQTPRSLSGETLSPWQVLSRAVIMLAIVFGTLWLVVDVHYFVLTLQDISLSFPATSRHFRISIFRVGLQGMLTLQILRCLAAAATVVGAFIATSAVKTGRFPFLAGIIYLALWGLLQLPSYFMAGATGNSIVSSRYLIQTASVVVFAIISVVTLTRRSSVEHN